MERIQHYFPNLSAQQLEQFAQLDALYREWNAQINVISRKDIDNLYIHHVLHSLALDKVMPLKAGAQVLDLGCGGGFPGIPLAILYPETNFMLVDSIAKKIKVVTEVSQALGLKNVKAEAGRVEKLKQRFDFVVTRAVAKAPKLAAWTRKLVKAKGNHSFPNGIWAYKGLSNMQEELDSLGPDYYGEIFPMKEFFEEEFFETKCLAYIQAP